MVREETKTSLILSQRVIIVLVRPIQVKTSPRDSFDIFS